MHVCFLRAEPRHAPKCVRIADGGTHHTRTGGEGQEQERGGKTVGDLHGCSYSRGERVYAALVAVGRGVGIGLCLCVFVCLRADLSSVQAAQKCKWLCLCLSALARRFPYVCMPNEVTQKWEPREPMKLRLANGHAGSLGRDSVWRFAVGPSPGFKLSRSCICSNRAPRLVFVFASPASGARLRIPSRVRAPSEERSRRSDRI